MKFHEILRIPLDGQFRPSPVIKTVGTPSKNPGYFIPADIFENKMEQRSSARVRFSASAEVIHADLVESTLVTELSLRGCYLEPITPLPRRTLVTVKIYAGSEFFQAMATVLYSRATLGMGLGFREVKPEFQIVLRKWVHQALDKSYVPP